MYSPLAPAPSRPPPPDPTAEPASGSRGALPHRSLLAGAGPGPTAPVTMVSGRIGEAGKEEWERGRSRRGRRLGACALAGGGLGREARPPPSDLQRSDTPEILGAQSFLGRPPWTASDGDPARLPGPPPRHVRPGCPRVPLDGGHPEAPGLRVASFLLSRPPVGSSRPHPSKGSALRDLPLPSPTSGPGECKGGRTSSPSYASTEGLWS